MLIIQALGAVRAATGKGLVITANQMGSPISQTLYSLKKGIA